MPTMHKLSSYRTTVAPAADGGTEVTYAETKIVHVHPDRSVTLRNGGYSTVTTKRKMNQAANQFGLGFSVWQKAFDWFVTDRRGVTVPFVNGMTINQAEGV